MMNEWIRHFKKADKLADSDNPQRALKEYEIAAQLNPQHWLILVNWGVTLNSLGRFTEARKKFKQADKLDPNNALIYYNWGCTFVIQKKFDEVKSKFEKVVRLEPDNYFYRFELASLLINIQDYQKAREHLEILSKTHPDDNTVFVNLGIVFSKLGFDDVAIKKYQYAASLNSQDFRCYDNWGISLAVLGRYDEAIDKFQSALRIDPDSVHTLKNYGRALSELNKNEDAIRMFEKALLITPNDGEIYCYLGIILFLQGKMNRAVEKFSSAEKNNFNNYRLYSAWGHALFGLARYKESVDKLEMAAELNPNDWYIYFKWGYALWELGLFKEAVAKFNKSLTINPDDLRSKTMLVACYIQLEDYESAQQLLDKLEKYEPEEWEIIFQFGNLNLSLNNNLKALSFYRKALTINKKYWGLYLNAGVSAYRMESFDRAIRYFRKAVSLEPNIPICYGYLGKALSMKVFVQEPTDTRKGKSLLKTILAVEPDKTHIIDLAESIKCFKRASEISKDTPSDIYRDWASALSDSGRFDEALEKYDKALSINPNSAGSLFGKGIVFLRLGKYEDAVENFIYSLPLADYSMPETEKLVYNVLGYCHLKLDDLDNALTYYEKVRTIDNDDEFVEMTIEHIRTRIRDRQEFNGLLESVDLKITKKFQEYFKKVIEQQFSSMKSFISSEHMITRSHVLEEDEQIRRHITWQNEETRKHTTREHEKTREIIERIFKRIQEVQKPPNVHLTVEKTFQIVEEIHGLIQEESSKYQFDLVKFEEKVLETYGHSVSKISSDSRKILTTAEYLFHNNPTNLDFAPTMVEYAKVVEIELYERFMRKLQDWAISNKKEIISESTNRTDVLFKPGDKPYVYERKFKRFDLGGYQYLLENENTKQFVQQQYSELANYILDQLGQDTLKVSELRNSSAHKNSATKEKVSELRTMLIEKVLLNKLIKL